MTENVALTLHKSQRARSSSIAVEDEYGSRNRQRKHVRSKSTANDFSTLRGPSFRIRTLKKSNEEKRREDDRDKIDETPQNTPIAHKPSNSYATKLDFTVLSETITKKFNDYEERHVNKLTEIYGLRVDSEERVRKVKVKLTSIKRKNVRLKEKLHKKEQEIHNLRTELAISKITGQRETIIKRTLENITPNLEGSGNVQNDNPSNDNLGKKISLIDRFKQTISGAPLPTSNNRPDRSVTPKSKARHKNLEPGISDINHIQINEFLNQMLDSIMEAINENLTTNKE